MTSTSYSYFLLTATVGDKISKVHPTTIGLCSDCKSKVHQNNTVCFSAKLAKSNQIKNCKSYSFTPFAPNQMPALQQLTIKTTICLWVSFFGANGTGAWVPLFRILVSFLFLLNKIVPLNWTFKLCCPMICVYLYRNRLINRGQG